MTQATKSATLRLPGAKIHYEVRGSGPTLLVIPGGPQDAGVFADLSAHLADRYTVVTYDPRGNSRSTTEGDPGDLRVDQHADDAARLIEEIDGGPAYVFGTSGGAQIGLDLTVRHPALVRALVAHEPPCLLMLDDPSAALAADQELDDTYRREGVDAAMQKFFNDYGLADEPSADAPPVVMTDEEMETFGRVSGNFEYWLAHGMMPLSLYRPDVDALRTGGSRVAVGIGEASAGQTTYRTAVALAEKLGTEPVRFPGDHVGYGPHADTFAETLHRAFGSQ